MMNWESVKKFESTDENVFKYVFTNGTAIAESVLYRYGTFEERTVICCSTMSGCPVGCRFCGAGDFFARILNSDEIVAQVTHLIDSNSIDTSKIKRFQIMFMSMGEPMMNYTNLAKALIELNGLYPKAALLISTSGPKVDYGPISQLSRSIPKIGLQFSVHESTDEAGDKLIPFRHKLNLAGIAEAGLLWHQISGRRPYFNYCAHPGNTAEADVERLRALFDPDIWECTISVVCERDESVAAANSRQLKLATDFADKMLAKGYGVRTFNPAGQDDIGGGCGQLWFVQQWMKDNPDKVIRSVGYGLDKVHTPT